MQTATMIQFAARRPAANAESIVNQGLAVLGLKSNQNSLTAFGVQAKTEMLTCPARVLNPPKVQYNKKDLGTQFGSWNLKGVRFQSGATVGRWGILVLNTQSARGYRHDVDELARQFEDQMKFYGVGLDRYNAKLKYHLTVEPTDRGNLNKSFNNYFENFKKDGLKLVLILLPSEDRYTYSRIKFFGDVKFGIHTQAMVGKKVENEKGLLQYLGNIAMKVNLRMGGTNHFVQFSQGQLKPTDMLVGIDVTHPSPTSANNAPSIAAMVASKDALFSQYPCSLRTQASREEMVEALEDMFVERLTIYRKNTGKLPLRVLVYRDGVSEGQFHLVLEREKPCLEAAFLRLYGEAKNWPKLMIVIVGKRHHTRFFPTSADQADRASNPLPGTVVDRHITMERGWDFYMQPHAGLQGTARPGHYSIIWDQWKLGADQLEQLVCEHCGLLILSIVRYTDIWTIQTHSLCYSYGRATKAVSRCPPAYWADVAAERGRAYLHASLNESSERDEFNPTTAEWSRDVHQNLMNYMFYV